MRTALVYDRVNKWGGAERVLLALHEIFPEAPLFTSLYHPQKAKWASVFPKVIPSFLQNFKYLRDKHELLAPLMPLAFESFDFAGFNLVISVTSEAAKGIITKLPTKHICYCLTPTRYLWSSHETYFKGSSFKSITRPVVSYLRRWDKIAANRPDLMVGISTEVQRRITQYYGRDSRIIHPPTTKLYEQSLGLPQSSEAGSGGSKDYFLVVSRLTPYKRVDLAIEVFNRLKLPLVVIGKGSEEARLKRSARNNIKFAGEVSDGKLAQHYRRAWALVMPQEEDFGIVAVEAQALGVPVIAYAKGGARDTVIDGKTGLLFGRQTVTGLVAAVKKFEKMKFDEIILRKNAEKFSKEKFKKKIQGLISQIK